MSDPVTLTTATLVALAASKFVETAAAKVGEVATPAVLKQAGSQIDQLWGRIKAHFAKKPKAEAAKAEAAIVAVEKEQSEAALTKLAVYLDDDLSDPQHQTLQRDLQQLAQQIINISQQHQQSITINATAHDSSKQAVVGENSGTINL
jgi:phosphoribosylformylglycinamidine (FGAM) synthase PurS component